MPELNPTEERIILLLAQGKSDKEIAPKLNIKPKSVIYYVSKIILKTGCYNRPHLISFAYENGLIKQNLNNNG